MSPDSWENHVVKPWKTYVANLPRDQLQALVDDVGIRIPGFRRGSMNMKNMQGLHENRVRNALERAPSTRNGEPFLKWFKRRYRDLLDDLASVAGEDHEPDRVLQEYPAEIVIIALSVARPDLLERWKERIAERGQNGATGEVSEPDPAEESQLGELQRRLEAIGSELEALRQNTAVLDRENRKLKRQTEALHRRLQRTQAEAERNLAKKDADIRTLREQYQHKSARCAQLESQLEEARGELQRIQAVNDDLMRQMADYQNARRERDALFRLYRALSGHTETEDGAADKRVLLIGETFPTQTFRVGGRLVRLEATAPPPHIDSDFVRRCQTYDRVVLLASCPHRIRLEAYWRFGSDITEIPGLAELRNEMIFEEESL